MREDYKPYLKHYEKYQCSHCWVWASKNMDWTTEDGKIFRGAYLVMICGHCNKQGQIVCKWNPDIHAKIPQGSREGFTRVHARGECPSKGAKAKKYELEYADDF